MFRLLLGSFFWMIPAFATLQVGVGTVDITPPIDTPSAGCFERTGNMTGIHDPLFASAMVIDNGEKMVAFCSIDHMGLLANMVEEVKSLVKSQPELARCEVFLSSTHTHSGSGGYLSLPGLGDLIAGPYDPNLVKIAVEGAAQAIIQAGKNLQPALLGIGFGQVKALTVYDGVWPPELEVPTDLTLIKATTPDGAPLSVFINYSLYPDMLVFSTDVYPLPQETLYLFSSDVVGSLRTQVQAALGVNPIFFNGPKGELLAKIPYTSDRFKSCDEIAQTLTEAVGKVWNSTSTENFLDIKVYKEAYTFEPKPTPSGFLLPIESYQTEMSLIVFNRTDAFLTIPGELSCSCDPVLKQRAREQGFKHLAILDIVNDAHGYIYSPESWRRDPDEVEFSWGGEMYGQEVEERAVRLLNRGSLL